MKLLLTTALALSALFFMSGCSTIPETTGCPAEQRTPADEEVCKHQDGKDGYRGIQSFDRGGRR